MNALLDAALAYARAGLPIFPLLPQMKTPFGPHTCGAPTHQNGFKDAVNAPIMVDAWWREHPNANIGLATGRGLDVLDPDGPVGEATLAALVAKRWPLPETCTVETSPGHRHVYFRSAGWPCTTARLGPKLDTRGLGGYVLLPPSVHPSGAVYTWTNLSRPAPAPAWLTALLYRKPGPVAPPVQPRVRSSNEDDAIEQASRYLADVPPAIQGQNGSRATFLAAVAMRGFELTEAEAFELMWTEYNPRCVPSWRERDLRHKVREAFSKARKVPHLLESGRAS